MSVKTSLQGRPGAMVTRRLWCRLHHLSNTPKYFKPSTDTQTDNAHTHTVPANNKTGSTESCVKTFTTEEGQESEKNGIMKTTLARRIQLLKQWGSRQQGARETVSNVWGQSRGIDWRLEESKDYLCVCVCVFTDRYVFMYSTMVNHSRFTSSFLCVTHHFHTDERMV